MTIVKKVAIALASAVGKEFSSKEIKALTIDKFPELKSQESSILPGDYVGEKDSRLALPAGTVRTLANGGRVFYADRILKATANGFLVLPVSEHVMKPSTKGAKGVSLDDALVTAKAKIATAPKAPSTPANGTPVVKAEVSKAIAGETAKPVSK